MAIMTLRELCKESGATRRAIQGYEQVGLVKATGKNKYGHLLYDEVAQERICLIRLYQRIGFHIKEIKNIIDASDEVKIKALTEKVAELKTKRKEVDEVCHIAEKMISEMLSV